MENKSGKREIEIVPGNGNLDISPVEDHINTIRNNKKPNKENIVIPHEKKEKEEKNS